MWKTLPKGHAPFLLAQIHLGVRAGLVPAEQTAKGHRLLLGFGDASFLIKIVRETAVFPWIILIPLRLEVPALAALEEDEGPVAGQSGVAHIRQALRKMRVKAVLLCHDAPVIAVPEVDI